MQSNTGYYQRIPCYFVNPKDGTEMVLVPGGWFWMGSDDTDSDASAEEKPKHLHYVAPFYLAVTCVTVAQFRQFVKETGHKNGKDCDKDPDDHPVRYVSWHDASAYCKWADLRLPTEAEWELGSKGYDTLKYPWGHDWDDGNKVRWNIRKNQKEKTAPVFGHPDGTSPLGTFQQSGNLWEWCSDRFGINAYGYYSGEDFKTPPSGVSRVLRGGSWYISNPKSFRSVLRYNDLPANRSDHSGFRPARTVTF